MADERFTCVKDFEEYAAVHLTPSSRVYTNSGADDEVTLNDNIAAFKRWRLRPRALVDISGRTTATTILGHNVDFPVGVGPSAAHRMAHPDGEVAVAKAAADMNTIYIMSTVASSSVEEVTSEAPRGTKWLQLYVQKEKSRTEHLIRRAESCGFSGLVVTIDSPVVSKRREAIKHPPSVLSSLEFGNFMYPGADLKRTYEDGAPRLGKTADDLTWKDIHWLKTISTLPIILKGIMTAEDAELAIQHGADAIFVSNHGGRQLDSCLATIDVLPEIVKAVNGRAEIYLDGGVRNGTDVLKALGLGAKAVFLGRPIIWGLSYKGYVGVKQVLDILKQEFSTALALTGCNSPSDVDSSRVVHESKYSRL